MKHTSKLKRAYDPAAGMSIQGLEMVGEHAANIIVHTHPIARGRRSDPAPFSEAIASAFGNKVRVLPGSAYYPIAGNRDIVTAMVILNQETRAAGDGMEEAFDGLTLVTASVYEDEDSGEIWRKVGEGENAFLIKETDDDLLAILEARRSPNGIVTAAATVTLHEKAAPGSPIGWYDTGSESMRFGACLATTKDKVTGDDIVIAMDAGNGRAHEIDARQVHIVSDETSLSVSAEIAAGAAAILGRTGLTRENFLAAWLRYAADTYGGRHSAYFQRMKALMEQSWTRAALRAA